MYESFFFLSFLIAFGLLENWNSGLTAWLRGPLPVTVAFILCSPPFALRSVGQWRLYICTESSRHFIVCLE